MNHRTEISTLLLTQHGLITKQQVLAAGFTAKTVSRALDRGAYEEVLPGVMRSVQHPLTFESRAMAAQLHAGPGAALSGPTAARLYGVRGMPRERVWLRTAARSRARLPGWVTRTESAWLFAGYDAVHDHDGWRLLAPTAMLLTLAEVFNDHRFERAAEDAWHLAIVTPHEAATFLDDPPEPWATGIRTIRPLDPPDVRPSSPQSERIRARCARCGTPRRPARAGAPVPRDAGDRRGRPPRPCLDRRTAGGRTRALDGGTAVISKARADFARYSSVRQGRLARDALRRGCP